jgi:DNA-binding NarL/FixJ family response regulator
MVATTVQALGFEIVGACVTASEALAASTQGNAEIALLDLDLGPGPSGVDIAHALRARLPTIGIVMLTSFSDPRLKDPNERELPVGARFLVKSRLDSAEELRQVLLETRRHPLQVRRSEFVAPNLTPLQIEVLRLVASGESNLQIAQAQGVSEKAVERTVQRISESLGISDQPGNKRVLLSRAYFALTGKTAHSP